MGIEELTREELVDWIRENVPEINEDRVVVQCLRRRYEIASQKSQAAGDRMWEINDQIVQLIEKYADGPVKPGVKLRSWPASAQEEYEKLDQERKVAREAEKEWWEKSREAIQTILDFGQKQIDRCNEYLKGETYVAK